MNSFSPGYFGHPRSYRQGWAYSILLHTMMGACAVALASGFSPSFKPDSFQWNVALLESPSTPPMVDSPARSTPDAPPKPQPVKSRLTSPEPTGKQVHHTTEVAAVNQTASTMLTEPNLYSEVNQVTSPVTPNENVFKEEPVVANEIAPPEATPPVVEPLVSQSTPDSSTQPPQMETTSESLPIQQPSAEQLVASAPPINTAPAASVNMVSAGKTDLEWLTKFLLSRINELKNYPHMARINKWEGKVVLRAVIKDDGQVLMITVHESSGRSILDNDAMETLKKASPLKLDHPLGKSQVAILMPISYSLR